MPIPARTVARDTASARPRDAAAEALQLADALGSPRAALSVLALRLAEPAGWLPQGACAQLARSRWAALVAAASDLRRRTGGALPPFALPARASPQGATLAAQALDAEPPELLSLSAAAEALLARALGQRGRRAAGVYFTPPELAAHVVQLGLDHGAVPRGALPSVLDPCAGAGAFLGAAALLLSARATAHEAALRCAGSDLHLDPLRAARALLALIAGPAASGEQLASLRLRRADALQRPPAELADLLVSNPPYGHVDDAAERARIAARLPALRGGEVDRYAAFLLRSLQLVRPSGTAALLVPDTWMTNARGGGVRAAVLEAAEIAAVVDLGKPFAAAKDTRVQAVVLVRREGPRPQRPAHVARLRAGRLVALAPLEPEALSRSAKAGWQPYRTPGERDLCEAMEAASLPLGQLCQVGYGLRTGDNARHLVRGPARNGEVALVGGEDIVPFALRWRPKHLRASSMGELGALAQRQLGRPRVAIQRIRTNSAQPWARWLEAAPCAADQVCLDSLSTLASDDEELLWALLGLVGSVALDRCHRLRTTDVNVKPSALGELPAPRALLQPGPRAHLAALARERAAQAAQEPPAPQRGDSPAPLLERRIDRAIYELYELPARLIEVAERGFWGDRYPTEGPRL